MGIGAIGLSTSQKRDLPGNPGPPFETDSADNGLSVDPVTGRIVLGNDVGDPAAPAALITSREINTTDAGGNNFSIFLNAVVNAVITELAGNAINITGGNSTSPSLMIAGGDGATATLNLFTTDSGTSNVNITAGTNGTAVLGISTGPDFIQIFPTGFGEIAFRVGGIQVWGIDTATFFTQIGPTLTAYNGATLQVTGTMTKRQFPQSTGVDLAINRDVDSGKIFRNSAAVIFTLPNFVGANDRPGFYLVFTVANAGGITIQAEAGQTMRIGSIATTVGGTFNSTEVGATIRIVLISSTTWHAEYYVGAWSTT